MHSLEHERTVSLPAPPRERGMRARRTFGMAMRIVCVAVAVGAIALLCWQAGIGIGQVREGEMTGAQMLSALGQWLRGIPQQQRQEADQPQPSEDERPNSTEPPASEQPSETNEGQDLYSFDRSLVPDGARAVVPVDLFDGVASGIGEALLWQAPAIEAAVGEVLVLIVHSHGGEGYTAQGTAYLKADAIVGRSDDAEQSVVGVGRALSDALNDNGISAIHLSTRFDDMGNAGAFERTANAVAAYLERYPTIRYVIDVHRDAGLDDTGDLLRAVTWHEGAAVAQTRWIVPKDGVASDLASALGERMNAQGAHLCYAVQAQEFGDAWNFDGVYTLRAEIGTAGNSAQEAENAAKEIARALGELLT